MEWEALGKSNRAATFSIVFSVLVTEIQPPRVCAVNESFKVSEKSFLPIGLGRVGSCDKRRNDGGEAMPPTPIQDTWNRI